MSTLDYWEECISIAADELELTITPEQLRSLAEAAEGGHENYGMAFYSPPASDRINDIESEWRAKLASLQAEFDAYRGGAEKAVKTALRRYSDDHVAINPNGEVYSYDGRITRIL